jgi:hypothetical protein
MVVAGVSRGVTPAWPTARPDAMMPDQRMEAAPPPPLPVLKCVSVLPGAPLAGKAT